MGCLVARPFARRVEDDGVGFGELIGQERPSREVAALGAHARTHAAAARGRVEGGHELGLALDRVHLGAARQRECQRAAASVEVDHPLGLADRAHDDVHDRGLGLRCGLQEGTGGQVDGDTAEADLRLA